MMKTEGEPESPTSFFQQGTWMMMATVAGGILMSLVHTLSKKVPDAEYAAFGALLQILIWMAVPAIGLQTMFARQAAEALTLEKEAALAAAFRAAMFWTFLIWVATAVGMALGQQHILRALKIGNPLALWVTVAAGLGMLWLPIVQGLLQGRQDFCWLGWTGILNGAGRLSMGAAIVACGGMAAGIMTGTLIGLGAAVGTGLWITRDIWRIRPVSLNYRAWLGALVPLSVVCGIGQFMMSADIIVAQVFLDRPAPYIFGGTLARATVILAGSLTAVMFPKVVGSLAKGTKTNVVNLTLCLTAALGLAAAAGLRIGAPLFIRMLSKDAFLAFVPLLHLYALAMVPLALANVLISDMIARGRFRCLPWLGAVAVLYWVALQHYHSSYGALIALLGGANLTLLSVCVALRQVDCGLSSATGRCAKDWQPAWGD